jgi:hypothetical protein
MNFRNSGFTLIESVIVVTILGILASLTVPEVLEARNLTRAETAGSACRTIETAKNLWKKDFPGADIPNMEALNRYFPSGTFPQDPWGCQGVAYLNVTDLKKPVEHIYNNKPDFEPVDNCAPDNGYNDAFQPVKKPKK